MTYLAFALGLSFGACLGVAIMCLMVVASDERE